jgi:hypothetical protein
MAALYFPLETGQLFLEGFVKQFMALLAQKDKLFGFPKLVDTLFFL